MKRIFAGALALFSALTFGATLNPIQLLNPAGSTAGQVISSTGATTAPVWGGVTLSSVTGTLAVNHGGTGVSSASGTALDNITGFASTGFVTRTGAGTYAFQSTTNGITLGNLAQAAANTVLANGTGSTANVTAYAMPSCSGSANALQWTSGTGFICGSNYALLSSPAFGGTPTAPTAATNTNTTQLATTAFVEGEFANPPAAGFGSTTRRPVLATTIASNAGIGITSGGISVLGGITSDSISATSTITPSQTNGIVGTTTNNNANAGSFGEYVTNTTSGTSLTTGTPANCTSASLTAGDWDVSGTIQFVPAGSTTVTQVIASNNSVSATLGGTSNNNVLGMTFTTGAAQTFPVPVTRYSLSGTTTVYIVGQSAFGVSTMTCTGFIRARRVR